MIGELRSIFVQFYNSKTNRMETKKRPALVIAQADCQDYVILPVSTISRKQNIDSIYDIEIDPLIFPKSNLKQISYVRTHKQQYANRAQIDTMIGDIKTNYPDLYLEIIEKRENFSSSITDQALS